MARENLGDTFLRKLCEKTVNNEVETIDMYEIGKEIGLLDKTQTYNLVNELIYHGYIRKKDGSKINLSDKGRKRVEI
jgi:predicted transcriptional regulator